MPPNRFGLLENPASAPYAPLLEMAAAPLMRAHRAAPSWVALVLETPGQPDVRVGPRAHVALELEAIASRSGAEARAALLDLGAHVRSGTSTAPGFDCVVVTRRGSALFRLPTLSLGEEGAYTVASAISVFRGLEEATAEWPLPADAGFGYAVRAAACSVCTAWREALRAERIPLVGRVAPEEPPIGGEICLACYMERDSVRRIAGEQYGLDIAAVDEASEPKNVIGTAQLNEDWEGRHG